MSITDELRKYAQRYKDGHDAWSGIGEELDHIADRIDAKHEEKVSYWQGACYEDGYKEGLADHEDAMAEHGWVKLPVDADGEVIHLGDRVENNERVVRIVLTDGSWEPSVYVEKLPNVLHEYFCNETSHYHEPTVEDVLRELVAAYMDTPIDDSNDGEFFAEFAAKLRLAGDVE